MVNNNQSHLQKDFCIDEQGGELLGSLSSCTKLAFFPWHPSQAKGDSMNTCAVNNLRVRLIFREEETNFIQNIHTTSEHPGKVAPRARHLAVNRALLRTRPVASQDEYLHRKLA